MVSEPKKLEVSEQLPTAWPSGLPDADNAASQVPPLLSSRCTEPVGVPVPVSSNTDTKTV